MGRWIRFIILLCLLSSWPKKSITMAKSKVKYWRAPTGRDACAMAAEKIRDPFKKILFSGGISYPSNVSDVYNSNN